MTSESVKLPIDPSKIVRSKNATCFLWPLEVYFNFVIKIIMQVKAALKKRCKNCKIIKRKGVLRVICENPKHKQRQG